MPYSYEALRGEIETKFNDLEYQVIIAGRYLAAEAYYLGSNFILKKGDPVLILGTRGAKVLIAPFYGDAFLR